jgi:hypothetical protein
MKARATLIGWARIRGRQVKTKTVLGYGGHGVVGWDG